MQQTRIIKQVNNVTVIIRMRDRQGFTGMSFQKDVLVYLWKVVIVLDDFKVMGSPFQILGAAIKKVSWLS